MKGFMKELGLHLGTSTTKRQRVIDFANPFISPFIFHIRTAQIFFTKKYENANERESTHV